MERIHYAGDTVLTGSDIARALLDYAGALASKEGSETAEIPCRLPDGSVGRANFLIGPASQLVSVPEESEYEEISDPELVATLQANTARLRGANVVSPGDPIDYTDDFDNL